MSDKRDALAQEPQAFLRVKETGGDSTLAHLLHFEGMKLASARFLQRGSGEAAVADSKM